MTSFSECLQGQFQHSMDFPSVTLKAQSGQEIQLKFTNKDVLTEMTYLGPRDAWLSALCALSRDKTLSQLESLGWREWDSYFGSDQTYWDFKAELADQVYFKPAELLKAALDKYRGREYLYREPDALICRCFGVRENDLLDYVRNSEDPTPEGLALATKAGMGCRSCVPQMTKWLSGNQPRSVSRFYKERGRAEWLLEIDSLLQSFPLSLEWGMEVESFQASQVIISFEKNVSQAEKERVGLELQDFLARLDADLSFFLRRSWQRSKARG